MGAYAAPSGYTNYFSRTSNLAGLAAFTCMGVFKMLTTVAYNQNIFSAQLDANNNIYYSSDGGGQLIQWNLNGNGVDVQNIVTPPLNEWFFLGFTISGTVINNYYALTPGGTMGVVTSSATAATWFAPSSWYLAQRPDSFGTFSGVYGFMKIWGAALTQRELDLERRCVAPVRTLNLNGCYDFTPGAAVRGQDRSGNGNNWTENGTITDFAPAPVPYRRPPFMAVVAPAAGNLLVLDEMVGGVSDYMQGGFT